jgi:hypothetical protein
MYRHRFDKYEQSQEEQTAGIKAIGKHKGTGTLCTRLKKRSFVHFFAEIFGGNGKNTYICTMKLKFNDIYGTQSKTNKWYWHLSCDA